MEYIMSEPAYAGLLSGLSLLLALFSSSRFYFSFFYNTLHFSLYYSL